ncbi:sensor domain-containing diguanylate cyclase [Vibrio penaeicida]|uniref:diguanylate cyclase n=1 Tax=Vibrio penaeicida TaxID=104609 RepID=A0AAV5NZ37_9VIBR|nr:diguanylate cyclase [Vibrio penaeicida]RTZ24384.1 diguanylate cyclase [Vibrio penaeicida]GLQ75584.1 hypothetical protein GCM10007932_49460 [Vibrio penaeicida]
MNDQSSSEKVIRRLYQITNSFSKGIDVQIQELLQLGCERFQLDIGILSRIRGENYTIVNVYCPSSIELNPGDTFPFLNTYCEVTCFSNKPVAIEHVGEHDEFSVHPAYEAFALESYIGIPVHLGSKLFGTLNFSSPKPYEREFSQVDIDALQLMASWISVELVRNKQEQELKKLNAELEKLALFDPLTELPNRHSMLGVIPRSIGRLAYDRAEGAVALIDIDHFKKVNDNHGHLFGDKILAETASGIADAIRDVDLIARFGGEEFVIWLPRTNHSDISKICDRIMSGVSRTTVDEKPVTVSIGVCHFKFNTSYVEDPKSLLDDFILSADTALYEAKENGRNRVVYNGFEVD